ncbi:1-acyl-sn-glycerol-3-phosphate acyltransferase [Prolixibacteraceae bacterium Z1-6]|uniref:1-acyl-sn-glycerol-3-phosphate acyltransferase n=1 Tax=Draconibacterium aestuarii TaxID=2998507 RepID=A0A9X3J844_9BACT|nr:1-acyl-sn-glycerol-3-phosphate acyltransferase [Prolixibacteraceae bacterium Z1-6]
MKGFCKFWLKILGWKTIGGVAPENKCIIIGAPHTSAWDFVISWLFYTSIGGLANVLIKKEFFFWPVSYFLRKMGGLPIDRSKGANVIRQTIQLINNSDKTHLALTPEGTRDLTIRWKGGFHIIAKETEIPVYLGYFDWGRKEISIGEKFELSDNANDDIKRMKDFYREKGIKGKFPDKFTTEY